MRSTLGVKESFYLDKAKSSSVLRNRTRDVFAELIFEKRVSFLIREDFKKFFLRLAISRYFARITTVSDERFVLIVVCNRFRSFFR